jgi:two-component system, chemotaxis family, CheB/CheR fusion protein
MNRDHDANGDAAGVRDPALAGIVEHVRSVRGVDLGAFKPATLRRRIDKRLETLGVDSYDHYVDRLEAHPDEFPRLFDTILINVTAFFRDQDAWDELQASHLPRILDAKHQSDPIRVWSAGCSSGQESYSIAMLLREHLGEGDFWDRVKIYATDVDEDALVTARAGTYRQEQVTAVPDELLERYFEPTSTTTPDGRTVDAFQVTGELRRKVIFGRHDILTDPPISKIDLLLCRNTLMYFNADIQIEALYRFHFALRDHGLLLLGAAEKLLNHPGLFTPTDGRRRFFTKQVDAVPPRPIHRGARGSADVVSHLASNVMLRDSAMESGNLALVVVGQDGRIAIASSLARSMFQLAVRDLGRPLQDLELSYRPAELRAAIDRATEGNDVVELRGLEWRPSAGDPRYLDIDVAPLHQDGEHLGTLITFSDATERHRLSHRLTELQRQLEAAHLDLQTTNEELETVNEELQSTVEELETTNEELRSTNEELETINADLQSTNDELQAANERIGQRGQEIDEVNAFLGAVLRSFRRAVVVIDDHMVVRIWNDQAEELWGLRGDEVRGQYLLNLDIGMPLGELHEPLRRCLSDPDHREELVLDAHNRRGSKITCAVTMSSLINDGQMLGAILLMEESQP